MILKTATRQKVKIRMSIASPTGFGKTYSALQLAYGITGDWTKIAVIDSENGSADLYADLGPYQTLTLEPPFSPERYIQAIKTCEDAGMEVIILDSVTHVWNGKGGLLEYKDSLGGKFQDWAKVTPMYQDWLHAILYSKAHVIATMRKKQAYSMTTVNGKTVVEKAGLDDQIREGFDYEMTIAFEIINDQHLVNTSKDRTRLFMNKPEFMITPTDGQKILEWCELGEDINAQVQAAIQKLENCHTQDEVVMLGDTLPLLVSGNEQFRKAGNARFAFLRNEAKAKLDASRPAAETSPAPAAGAEDTPADQPAGKSQEAAESQPQPKESTEAAPAADGDPQAVIAHYKAKIQAATTPDQLSDLLDAINGLPNELRVSLRRTVSAKAKQMNYVANPDTKRFESATAEPAPTPVASESNGQQPGPPKPANPNPGELTADQTTLLGIINGATSSGHLASIATTSGNIIEASEVLNAAFMAKADAMKAKEQEELIATAKNLQEPAKIQTVGWFAERIGKKVWMQGLNGNFTGPYDIESEEYPGYMANILQKEEGYTFRELTPQEYEAAEQQAA